MNEPVGLVDTRHINWPIVVVDFEATALTLDSYPIEVGLAWSALPTGPVETWSTLITPDPAWDLTANWDPDAEKVHGITHWDLRSGMPAAAAMEMLNRLASSATYVWCDGGHYDRYWLHRLSEAAGIKPSFRLADI